MRRLPARAGRDLTGQVPENRDRMFTEGLSLPGEVAVKFMAWVVLLAVASIPVAGQTKSGQAKYRDRQRVRGDVSTVTPSSPHTAAAASNTELDRLEHQTARIASEPAAKSPQKAPAVKLPSDAEPHSSGGYQQTMPLHAHASSTTTSRNVPTRNPQSAYGKH